MKQARTPYTCRMADEDQDLLEAETRNRLRFTMLVATMIVAAFVTVAINRVFQAVQPGCTNTVIESAAAPGGLHTAVLFERSCGDNAGFSSQVSVLAAGQQLPDMAGNALVAVNGATAGTAPWGGPAVAVAWLSPDQLQLTVEAGALTPTVRESVGQVAISVTRP